MIQANNGRNDFNKVETTTIQEVIKHLMRELHLQICIDAQRIVAGLTRCSMWPDLRMCDQNNKGG